MSDVVPVFLDDGIRPIRTSSGPASQRVGSVLLRSADCVAMINLGIGPPALEPSELAHTSRASGKGGRLIASLAQFGLGCRDVEVVLFTHLLPHHLGWIEIAGEPTFPRARYQYSAAAWEHACHLVSAGGPGAGSIAQIVELGASRTIVDRGPTLVGGVSAVPARSSVPGELTFVLPNDVTVSDSHAAQSPSIDYGPRLAHTEAELTESP